MRYAGNGIEGSNPSLSATFINSVESARSMPTIAELNQAPGKSMTMYEDVEVLQVDNEGMFGDREYMWVEDAPHTHVLYNKQSVSEPGRFLSQREDPVLTQIIPKLTPEGLDLHVRGSNEHLFVPRVEDVAANRRPVSVWGWRGEAVDQGIDAAEWGEAVVGRPVRLVAVSDEYPRFVENNPLLGRMGFADAYSVTVVSTDSIKLVNGRLRQADVPEVGSKRPRATLVLAGLVLPNQAELPPHVFPEDYVDEIRVGADGLIAVLRKIKACGRCPVPDTNEITGERRGAPVRQALGKLGRNGRHLDTVLYGSGPELFWTQNFVIQLPKDMPKDATIDIRRGAEVEVVYSPDTNWA